MSKTLFISDLHLSEQYENVYNNFAYFIEKIAIEADALYVLGDLFDFWIGDDESSPFQQAVAKQFQKLDNKGIPCYFIRGNRDFILGNTYAEQAKFKILPDPSVIDLYGTPTLLMHGDNLSIDDKSYIRYRNIVYKPWLQWLFLKSPLFLRLKIAERIRYNSSQNKRKREISNSGKALNPLSGVTQSIVEELLNSHQANQLIHGHLHNPGIHEFINQLTPAKRIVLGDWGESGSYLVVTKSATELHTFSSTTSRTEN